MAAPEVPGVSQQQSVESALRRALTARSWSGSCFRLGFGTSIWLRDGRRPDSWPGGLFTRTCLKTGMSNGSRSNFQMERGGPSVTSSECYGAFLFRPYEFPIFPYFNPTTPGHLRSSPPLPPPHTHQCILAHRWSRSSPCLRRTASWPGCTGRRYTGTDWLRTETLRSDRRGEFGFTALLPTCEVHEP